MNIEELAASLRHYGLEPWRDGRSILDVQRPVEQHITMIVCSLQAEIAKLRAQVLDLRRVLGPYSSVEIALKAQASAVLHVKALERRLSEAVNSRCSCGGAGPGEGCDWCNLYHHVKGTKKKEGV